INGEYLTLDVVESAKGRTGITKRFPIGPILGITPFNFPLNLVAHKIAPALACGNTIILKPSPQCPITALKLGEIIIDSGAVPGSVNILPTDTSIAEMLVKEKRLKLLTFTGSADVGFYLKNISGKKKVVLELGGNAGVIIHSDTDINYAAERCAIGGFAYSGQMCISLQRIFVHNQIFEKFSEVFLEKVKNLKFGDPMNEDTIVGPLINEKSAKRTEEWINEAITNGAKVLTGGNRNKNIFEPTVITDVSPNLKVCSNEIFAPVITLTKYEDFNDAVKEVDNSRFGLQAGIFTTDINKIWHAYENIEVGGMIINDVPTFRIDHMPYGGVKDSGRGREGIKYAIEDMTETKLLVLNFSN
ncbi:aldehyde dehydrogenase family protein, partial [candidate division KSB1 bacterium]